MNTFGWKRKLGSSLLKSASSSFQEATGQRDSDDEKETLVKVARIQHGALLEDAITKSQRLKEEGTILAEAERYWEAVKKWDEALQLTPINENILDMKAQALLILHEVFPAAQVAEQVVKLNPRWWVGYQTLGRVQLGLGEVRLALTSFSKAVHLNPTEEDVWEEDLKWARSLLQEKHQQDNENITSTELLENNRQENNQSITVDGEASGTTVEPSKEYLKQCATPVEVLDPF